MTTETLSNRGSISDPLTDRELTLLEEIEHDPDVNQATLATALGVAVGTVNWHLKRLVSKGYVKVKRAQRRKLRYIITPEGLAFRALLTVNYIETSLRLYRRTRQRTQELIVQARQAGCQAAVIHGSGDIADICRLTCLEEGLPVLEIDAASAAEAGDPAPTGRVAGDPPVRQVARFDVIGAKVFLDLEARGHTWEQTTTGKTVA